MTPNIRIINDKITLYFCPVCKKGHMLDKGMNECDICHTKLEWGDTDDNRGMPEAVSKSKDQ